MVSTAQLRIQQKVAKDTKERTLLRATADKPAKPRESESLRITVQGKAARSQCWSA
jgi:hypothetical protein